MWKYVFVQDIRHVHQDANRKQISVNNLIGPISFMSKRDKENEF
jgi:hypothetical protein